MIFDKKRMIERLDLARTAVREAEAMPYSPARDELIALRAERVDELMETLGVMVALEGDLN